MRNTFPPAWKIFFVLIIFGTIAVCIYANSLHSPFIFDDKINIVENPHIRVTELSPSSLTQVLKSRSTNRPFANLTFALNYYFHQYHVFGYHLVNLLIHLITAGLVFGLARQTLALCRQKTTWPTFLAALLWLVNPLHTQSVTYIVQRMNALAALFYLLTMVCYIQARRIQQRADTGQTRPMLLFAAGAISAVLALASKEIAATLPVLLFLYEWYFFQDLDAAWLKRQAKWIGGALIILAAAGFLYLGDDPIQRIMAGYTRQSFTPGQRLLSEPRVIVYYLSLLFFPHPGRLTLIYDFPVSASVTTPLTTVLALITLAALIILAGYTARRQRLISFAVLWFLGTLMVESSFIGLALIFEHRTYLPSVFIAIALVWWLRGYLRPWPTAISLLIGMIAVSGLWTYQRNQIWQNEIRFWQDAANKTPRQAGPYNNLGLAHKDQGQLDLAMECFQTAIANDPTYARAHSSLGVALARRQQLQEAAESIATALHYEPDNFKAHNYMGNVLLLQKMFTKAAVHYAKAIQLNPYYVYAYLNLGHIKLLQSQEKAALECFLQATSIAPRNARAHRYLGELFWQKKRFNQAIHHFRIALNQQPADVLALKRLAYLHADRKNYDKAINYFKRLIALQPDGKSFYNLACLYARLEQTGPAVTALKKAIIHGYNNWEQIRSDPDLDKIRNSDFYQQLAEDNGF